MLQDAAAVSVINLTTAFAFGGNLAANLYSGTMVLTLLDPTMNLWSFSAVVGLSSGTSLSVSGGSKALSAELDRVRITNNGGADTFDAGSINIMFE